MNNDEFRKLLRLITRLFNLLSSPFQWTFKGYSFGLFSTLAVTLFYSLFVLVLFAMPLDLNDGLPGGQMAWYVMPAWAMVSFIPLISLMVNGAVLNLRLRRRHAAEKATAAKEAFHARTRELEIELGLINES